MSEICINYGKLENSAGKARESANCMRDYMEEIQQRVTRPLSQLEGGDDQGYVSKISEYASRKIADLNRKASQIEGYAARLENLCAHAKEADKKVASEIKDLGDRFVGDRNWIQKIGDFFYDTFCVDLLNGTNLGEAAGNLLKSAETGASSLAEDAKDWFKYKDGKYWWGIAETVLDVVVAVGAVVGAVAATGPMAIVGLVAAVIGLAISSFNAVFSLGKKMEALEDYSNGDLGKARYDGTVDRFSDYVEKTDMGDAEDNAAWENIANTVATVEVLADVAQGVAGAANVGAVRDAGGKIIKYDFSNSNVKKNLMDSFGFKKRRYTIGADGSKIFGQTWTKGDSGYHVGYHWEPKSLFSSGKNGRGALDKYLGLGKTDSFFYDSKSTVSTAKQFQKLGTGGKAAKTILEGGSVISTLMQRAEDADTIYSSIKNGLTVENTWDTVKSSCSMMNFLKLADDFDFTTPIDNGTRIWKNVYMAD